MSLSKAVLVSRDHSLMEAMHGVIASTRGFQLEILGDTDTACKRILADDQILLSVVHLDGTTNVAGLTRTLQAATQADRPVVSIAICEREHPEQTLALLRLGVADCLSRPLNLSRLGYLIDVLTIAARYRSRRAPTPEPVPSELLALGDQSPFLYVPSARMERMVEQIRRIAPLETTVMLGGETGTGKTHLAGVIHRLSPRRDQPFLTINCGALAANLIESEMFGHVKGAFTGANAERTGRFAAVGQGTLFLDEIDSLAPGLQAKLLRVVEERAFEPVGSNRTMRLRARLIVASNRPLEQEVAADRFRADLYYRFNVIAFELPPLRERVAMIPVLVRALISEFTARAGLRIEGVAPAAMQALLAHSWPGNIRELRNAIERAVALCPGEIIELEDLPEHFRRASLSRSPVLLPISAAPGFGYGSDVADGRSGLTADCCDIAAWPYPAGTTIPVAVPRCDQSADEGSPRATWRTMAESKERTEVSLITQALKRNGQNRLRAAAELGISRMTLYKKLHKYGLMEA